MNHVRPTRARRSCCRTSGGRSLGWRLRQPAVGPAIPAGVGAASKPLAVTGAQPHGQRLPKVATMAETGYQGRGLPGDGLGGRARTREHRPKWLQARRRSASRGDCDARVRERIPADGLHPVGSSPEQFNAVQFKKDAPVCRTRGQFSGDGTSIIRDGLQAPLAIAASIPGFSPGCAARGRALTPPLKPTRRG